MKKISLLCLIATIGQINCAEDIIVRKVLKNALGEAVELIKTQKPISVKEQLIKAQEKAELAQTRTLVTKHKEALAMVEQIVTNNYIVPAVRVTAHEALIFLTSKDTVPARLALFPFGAFSAYSAIRNKDWKPVANPVAIASLMIGLSAVAQTDTAQSIASTTASASIYGLKTLASLAFNVLTSESWSFLEENIGF